MSTDSGFQRWKRYREENSSDMLVAEAEGLYSRAEFAHIRGAIFGGIWGFLCVTVLGLLLIFIGLSDFESGRVSSLGEVLAKFIMVLNTNARAFLVPWLFGTVIGGSHGVRRAERRAQRLLTIATMALALARIEAKLSKLEKSGELPRNDSPSLT